LKVGLLRARARRGGKLLDKEIDECYCAHGIWAKLAERDCTQFSYCAGYPGVEGPGTIAKLFVSC
jgi:hypothetical protein